MPSGPRLNLSPQNIKGEALQTARQFGAVLLFVAVVAAVVAVTRSCGQVGVCFLGHREKAGVTAGELLLYTCIVYNVHFVQIANCTLGFKLIL